MNTIIRKIIALALLFTLASCSNFEPFENVIADKKVRPLTIELSKPEAAPGDTVQVRLYLHDAGLSYDVEWELALNQVYDAYVSNITLENFVDLDTMMFSEDNAAKPLEFSFVVPAGEQNPLLLSPMIPEEILSAKEAEELPFPGAEDGVSKAEMIDLLESMPVLPNEMTDMVDMFNTGSVVVANISVEGGATIEVRKALTVRYSNRVADGEIMSSVNENPVLGRVGLIAVESDSVFYREDEISDYGGGDTTWLSTPADWTDPTAGPVDTIAVKEGVSYFLFVEENDLQSYRFMELDREAGQLSYGVDTEDQWYSWFYTNLDDIDADWEDQLYLLQGRGDMLSPVIALVPPKDQSMHDFMVNLVVTDWRSEVALQSAAGTAVRQVRGYFKYE